MGTEGENKAVGGLLLTSHLALLTSPKHGTCSSGQTQKQTQRQQGYRPTLLRPLLIAGACTPSAQMLADAACKIISAISCMM